MSHLGAKQLVKSSVYSSSNLGNLMFVKSNAYMNESDKALKKFFETNKILPDQVTLVVLYDDFENDLGKVKISKFKKNESHNGIKSVLKYMKNGDNVFKLGVGIGPKPSNATRHTMADWVLSPFRLQDKEILESKGIPLAIDYIDFILEVEGEVGDPQKVNAYFSKNS